MLIDSHCHLDFPEYDSELDAVIDRARAAGVGGMVTISTRLERAPALRDIANRHAGVWRSVGVHPHEAEGHAGVTASTLADLAADARVVGIGETGLDYYYEHSPRAAQQELFRAHIAVARDTGLPLIVHTRDADEDTVRILETEMARGAFAGLIHCFSTSRWLADQALAMGLYISVAGIVTFRNADTLREVASTIPLDRLLVETDAPFLAPAPNRGKRNEPAFVTHTAARIAELRGIDAAALGDATSDNFFRLFTRADRAEAA
ncbi:MAG: TatD family hydrolase [Proteobacteria bacterium]|nr:TatD family hydrolase [Pseudomonadota bacterium]